MMISVNEQRDGDGDYAVHEQGENPGVVLIVLLSVVLGRESCMFTASITVMMACAWCWGARAVYLQQA